MYRSAVSGLFALPARYEALRRLGAGGGGEVWAVRDRYSDQTHALKVLAEEASEPEMTALVREAVALSGLEGLGVPRVLRFGRLPGTSRPYLVRDLVEGTSLEELMQGRAPSVRVLGALAKAAEQLTLVHRAGFFHGDVKPANIIVDDDGRATLVDLGLAAPWRERGTVATGLTPRYAAPELLSGGPLTVRSEVYALGVALRDAVERAGDSLLPDQVRALLSVVQRATNLTPDARHPSGDEFARALCRAARIEGAARLEGTARLEQELPRAEDALTWPILGIDATANRLREAVTEMDPGDLLQINGPSGSGRSVLVRRLAWSLGVEGRPLVWLDDSIASRSVDIQSEIDAHTQVRGLVLLIDDAEALDTEAAHVVREARNQGACLVVVGELSGETPNRSFNVPPLANHVAAELLKRAIPSLTEPVARKLLSASQGFPGELKRFVSMLAQKAVVSESDVNLALFGAESSPESAAPSDPLQRASFLLERGRYTAAREALDAVESGDPLVIAVARARLAIGLGEGQTALDVLLNVQNLAEARRDSQESKLWTVWLARAHIARAEYTQALELLATVREESGSLSAEALAFEGLALSHVDDQDGARAVLERAVDVAREAGDPRVQGLALTCLGLVMQRSDDTDQAEQVYHRALACAQTAGDASTLGTVQLNLAVLLMVRGDVARAIEHFEAAVDMGRRSGRRHTVRTALLQLANTDLYLGRLDRARSSIEALEDGQEPLPAAAAAQLAGLKAMLFVRTGELDQSVLAYKECAEAYEAIGSGLTSAEARLEGVLVATQRPHVDVEQLDAEVARAKSQLGDSSAHKALAFLATARVLLASGSEDGARVALDQGLAAAKEANQRDWVWRMLAARADLEEHTGQSLMARRDRIEAVTVLEEIGARLPRDLREVFWNDARRRELRAQVEIALSTAATQFAPHLAEGTATSSPISAFIQTPLEQRLARLLEVNRELLGELDLATLSAKVIECAVDLVRAERGFVILRDENGVLQVHSSSTRPGDPEHLQFSRSVAEQVIESREPVVSTSASQDSRMQGYASVHQMSIESIACVPIMARLQEPIGALYVETRRKQGSDFQREIPTLRAFADQVALAIETTRLINENRQRADQLSLVNEELTQAQHRLKELLGERTERLKEVKKELRETRHALYGRFGYHGVVGASGVMRRCFSLIDRVKSTDIPVLITGESGTGKEVIARVIHRVSERGKEPFLGINCGAIPQHLLESELFGHVRGAFTGADRDRKGLFREAKGGSVLLDEIGEMPQKMQAGLLRVLQERTVRPVGGTDEEPVQCRFIFATHRDLQSMVAAGLFREDLFYRIHVVELAIPALRERAEDIPLLVDHFLGVFAARYKRERKNLTREALRKLASYSWPGNVRQLEHVLLNSWVLSEKSEIDAEDIELPSGARMVSAMKSSATKDVAAMSPTATSTTPLPPLPPSSEDPEAFMESALTSERLDSLESHRQSEKDRILDALKASGWNRVKAAELSGIPRRTFYRRLRQYDIQ